MGRADGLEDGSVDNGDGNTFFTTVSGSPGSRRPVFSEAGTRSSGKQLGSGGANEEQILTGSQSLRSQPAFRNFGAGKQQQLGSDERMPEGELDWAE